MESFGIIQKELEELSYVVSKLRYVRNFVDVIEPDDHNLLVIAVKKIRDVLYEIKNFFAQYHFVNVDAFNTILQRLDKIIAKLRYVKSGDIVLSSDHNDLVDAVKTIREALNFITQYYVKTVVNLPCTLLQEICSITDKIKLTLTQLEDKLDLVKETTKFNIRQIKEELQLSEQPVQISTISIKDSVSKITENISVKTTTT